MHEAKYRCSRTHRGFLRQSPLVGEGMRPILTSRLDNSLAPHTCRASSQKETAAILQLQLAERGQLLRLLLEVASSFLG